LSIMDGRTNLREIPSKLSNRLTISSRRVKGSHPVHIPISYGQVRKPIAKAVCPNRIPRPRNDIPIMK
jgi:hypothetical protein